MCVHLYSVKIVCKTHSECLKSSFWRVWYVVFLDNALPSDPAKVN